VPPYKICHPVGDPDALVFVTGIVVAGNITIDIIAPAHGLDVIRKTISA
jgi:hypothetical protein